MTRTKSAASAVHLVLCTVLPCAMNKRDKEGLMETSRAQAQLSIRAAYTAGSDTGGTRATAGASSPRHKEASPLGPGFCLDMWTSPCRWNATPL